VEFLETLYTWFMSLGKNYGVNPIIFGAIYVGAIPFFTLSLAWLVRNVKTKKSIVLPVLSTSFFFVSAYLYLIISGENVPIWVYGLVILMLSYGGWSTYKRVKSKVKEEVVS
jgi:hypothetical protein